MGWCGGGGGVCATSLRGGLASNCTNVQWAGFGQRAPPAVSGGPPPTQKPMKLLRKRLKKLCCDHHGNASRSRPRQADRNLVPRRGADRPAGHADTRVGQAWLTAARAPRSTLRLGLSLRCRLPATRRRRGSCHADGKCRGGVTAFGGNQPQSCPRRTCRSRLRRRRLSHCRHRDSSGNRHSVAAPPYAPELNPIENVWEYLRANKLAITVFDDYDDIVAKTCEA